MRHFLAAPAFLFASLAAYAQSIDIVEMKGARPREGEVVTATARGIVLQDGAARVAIPWEKITGSITWDPDTVPGSMETGQNKARGADYVHAAADYAKAIASGRLRPVLLQECRFRLAECLLQSKDYTRAAETFQALLTDYPDAFRLTSAYPALVDCLTRVDPPKTDEALKAVAAACAQAKALDLPREFTEAMKLREGLLHEAKTDIVAAQAVYAALTASTSPRVITAANAGLGTCQLASKSYDRAKLTFKGVVEVADRADRETLARAWNGLGDCCLTATTPGASDVKEALMCFLRTATLYAPSPDGSSDAYARSLVMAARCFRTLAESDQTQSQREKDMAECRRLMNRFREEFGETRLDTLKLMEQPFKAPAPPK